MPNHPMPRGERGLKKKGMIGRDRSKQWTDCINCLSYRCVPLEITKKREEVEPGKFEMRKTATGRCPECGYQTFVSVMEGETYQILKPVLEKKSVLDEIVPKTTQEVQPDDVTFSPEDIKALTTPEE